MITIRSKKKQPAGQLVVISKSKGTTKKKKSTKATVRAARPRGSTAMRTYQLALESPFDPDSYGARCPSIFGYPTATYHYRNTGTISSSSGLVQGIFFPCPYLSLFTTQGTSGSSAYYTGLQQLAGDKRCYAAALVSGSLSSICSSYRVVGWGVRFRNLLPPTTATGYLTVCTLPMVGNLPGQNFLASNALASTGFVGHTLGMGLDGSGNIPTNIIEIPDAQTVTVQDIITYGLVARGQPNSLSVFDFHNSSNGTSVGSSMTFGVDGEFNTSTGAIISADNFNAMTCNGWNAIVFRGDGLPAGVVLEYELVYHLEVVPVPSSTDSSVPAADDARAAVVASSAESERPIISASSKPVVFLAEAATTAASAVGGPIGGFLARTLFSKLGLTM